MIEVKRTAVDYMFNGMFTLIFAVLGIWWVRTILEGIWSLIVKGVNDPFQGLATLIVIGFICYIKRDSIKGFKKKLSK
jgi:hypothetical protein